jgi:hypothetical protein
MARAVFVIAALHDRPHPPPVGNAQTLNGT